MKRHLVLCLLLTAACAKKEAHGPVGALDAARRAKAAACVKCHADEAKAEAAGPHSHSYGSVMRQWGIALHDPDKSPLCSRDIMAEKSITRCLRCHSPMKTVFDDSISSGWTGTGVAPWKELTVKKGEEIQAGSVDCLTCHAEGARVVTRADYKRTPGLKAPPGFCDPKASPAFSHVSGCVSCHEPVVKTYAAKFAADPAGRKSPFLDCNSCHMAKDANGKRGHYYYWDGDGKKLEAMIKPMFKGFTAKVERGADGSALVLRWPLDFIPHPLIPETPKIYIVTVEVVPAGGGAPAFTKTIRFFSPEDRSAEEIKGRNPGELVTIPAMGTFERRYDLPAGVGEKGLVRLTVLKKPNSDFRDEKAWPVLTRDFKL
jgi:hypothetical protein